MSVILYEKKNGIGIITLNRPEKRNALNSAMINGLGQYLHEAADDSDVKVIVIRAEGEKAFTAGFDLKESMEHILAKLQRVDDVAGKEVGHLLHALAAALRLLQIAADLGRAAHAGDLHLHAALLSHGAVEFLHQKVHGRACLLAVNVPEGQGDRLLFIQQRFFPAAGESKNKGAEQQKREKALFHKETSKTELVFAKEEGYFRNFLKFFAVMYPI